VTEVAALERRGLDEPDEVRTFDKTRIEVAHVGRHTVGRASLAPGWRWSECIRPVVGTEWCEIPHIGYVVSGREVVRLVDGTTMSFAAGDVYLIPAGHDAWVDGDDAVVVVEFLSAARIDHEWRH
jgi:hypothetical protein